MNKPWNIHLLVEEIKNQDQTLYVNSNFLNLFFKDVFLSFIDLTLAWDWLASKKVNMSAVLSSLCCDNNGKLMTRCVCVGLSPS